MPSAVSLFLILCSVTWVSTIPSIPHIPHIPDINTIIDGLMIKKVLDFYTLQSKGNISAACRTESKKYLQAITARKSWGLKMIDASGKLQSGIMSLNMASMGAYDQCLAIDSKDDDRIRGKYCGVRISMAFLMHLKDEDTEARSTAIDLIRSAIAMNGDHESAVALRSADDEAPPYAMGFRWDMCIPSGCSADDLQSHLAQSFGKIKFILHEDQCQTLDTGYELRQSDWWVVGILIVVAAGMIACTTYDIILQYTGKKALHPILLAFSWITNGRKILAINNSPDQLPCLHGIRFLSMMWVIHGHQYITTIATPLVNMLDALRWSKQWTSMFTIGSTVSVDTFFLLSGCLLMYGFLKSRVKRIPFNIPMFYIHRYLRLTPALIAIMVFQLTLIRFMGTGPLYPDIVRSNEKACEDWWWSSLLYVQNYVNPLQECVAQAWYLQVDMQLFWLSPLFLWPVAKWSKKAPYFLGALIIISTAIPLYIAGYYKFNAHYFKSASNPNFSTKYYAVTHARACTWFVGLGLGYLLFNTKGKRVKLTAWQVIAGWGITGALLLYIIFGTFPMGKAGYVYEPVSNTMFIGLHRTLWCCGVAWVIFACVHGYGGFVNTFLSLGIFQILGRLTYSMYLTHFIMQFMRSGVARAPIHFSTLDVLYGYWGTIIFDIMVAVVWVMAFEAPMATIDGLLLKAGTKRTQQPPAVAPQSKVEEDKMQGVHIDAIVSTEKSMQE